MDGLDTVLEKVLDGKYDLASAVKKDEARATLDEYTQLASAGDAKASALGHKVLVSAALAATVADGKRLEALGAHVLRGVREPTEIFALRL